MKLSYTIDEARRETGLGRSSIYKAISAGQLDARKAGTRTLITGASVKKFIDSLPPAAIRPTDLNS